MMAAFVLASRLSPASGATFNGGLIEAVHITLKSAPLEAMTPASASPGLQAASPNNGSQSRPDLAQPGVHRVMADRVLRTVVAYWDFVAANARLDIAVSAEARAVSLMQDAGKLIKGDSIPKAEWTRHEANLARESLRRIGYEQAFVETGAALWRAMAEPELIMTVPSDDFPNLDQAGLRRLTEADGPAEVTGSGPRLSGVMPAVEARHLQVMTMLHGLSSNFSLQLIRLKMAAANLERAQFLVRTEHLVLAAEKKKYRLGVATTLELLISEAQLTASQIQQVEARLAYALALARFRFESGSLLDPASEAPSVDLQRLTTIRSPTVE